MKLKRMKITRYVSCCMALLLIIGNHKNASAQDPHFSQFHAAPFSVNPALTGNFYGSWISFLNYRNQWAGPSDPFKTVSLSLETKLLTKRLDGGNTWGIGGMITRDETMGGTFNSTYASFNTAYHLTLDAENEHRIGLGLGMIYVNRRVDYSRLTFPQQFASGGFDTNLPTGESGFSLIKPFISASAGLLYSYNSSDKQTSADFGVAVYHANKPQQTNEKDENQVIQPRYTVYGSYSSFLSEQVSFNANALYQSQKSTNYWQVGAIAGFMLTSTENPSIISAGAFYRSRDAIIPYIGITHRILDANVQLGLSYDATVSKYKYAAVKPQTFELSLIFRSAKADGSLPCPWK